MRPLLWKLLKWGSLLLSVGSVAAAALLMWLHGEEEIARQPVAAGKKAETQVDQPLMVERRGNRLIWRLKADQARQQEDVMLLNAPTLELFTESGEVIPVRGRRATFEPLKRNIHFRGDVVVHYRQWVLTCDELRYDSSRDEMVVPGDFHLQGPDVEMKGRKMVANRETERVTVAHDVWVLDSRDEGLMK